MKKIICAGLLLVSFYGISQYKPDGLYSTKKIIIGKNDYIKGKDYVYDEWNYGMIVINDTVFSKQENLKYDVLNDRVLISFPIKNEVVEINDTSLTGFSIIENGTVKHDFVRLNSDSFVDTLTKKGFFEIVFNFENFNFLIKKHSVIIYDPNRSKGFQTLNNIPSEYKHKTTYFLKNDSGKYEMIRLKKKDILGVLTKNYEKIKSYVKVNKIKFHKESDVLKLVNYYYSLK